MSHNNMLQLKTGFNRKMLKMNVLVSIKRSFIVRQSIAFSVPLNSKNDTHIPIVFQILYKGGFDNYLTLGGRGSR